MQSHRSVYAVRDRNRERDKGLETTEDMNISLYSIEEYWEQLSGTHAEPDSRFVAVTKAYKQLDNEWYDYSPRKAVEVLELAPGTTKWTRSARRSFSEGSRRGCRPGLGRC